MTPRELANELYRAWGEYEKVDGYSPLDDASHAVRRRWERVSMRAVELLAPAESSSAPTPPRLSTEPDTMRPEVLDAQRDTVGGGEPGERT